MAVEQIIRPGFSSTCFADVSYDPINLELTLQFEKDGSTYTYYNVPRRIYVRLLTASSMGRFFNTFIRNNYSYE